MGLVKLRIVKSTPLVTLEGPFMYDGDHPCQGLGSDCGSALKSPVTCENATPEAFYFKAVFPSFGTRKGESTIYFSQSSKSQSLKNSGRHFGLPETKKDLVHPPSPFRGRV